MKFSLLVLVILIVGQVCLADDTTIEKAKNGTGPGRYSNNRHNYHRGHKDNYSHEKHHYRAPVIDDYVCDLEATILVVSSKHHVKEEKSYGKGNNQGGYNGGNQGGNYGGDSYGGQQQSYGGNQGGNYGGGDSYGGQQQSYGGNQGGNYGGGNQQYDQQQSYGGDSYGGQQQSYGGNQGGYEDKPKRHEYATPEALRLKCSHIATHSEHDCSTCCKLSARRYHSVSKHEIFGFIVNADEIKYDDKGYVRGKRAADYGNQPAAPAPSYGSAPAPSYDSQPAPEYSAQTPGYSSDSTYPAAPANYGGSSYGYDVPPKSARCVCCAPKRHEHNYHHKRRHHHKDRSYDRSDEY